MDMSEFIRKNRSVIDNTIRAQCDNLGRLTDEDREDWIANDESLYNMALDAGVAV